MSINGDAMFDRKKTQFAAQGSQNRFPRDYIFAVNSAVDEYCALLEETAPDHITSQEQDIDLDENREWIISTGIDRWIIQLGNFKSGDMTLADAMIYWERALDRALHLRDKEAIDAATDSDTTAMSGEVIGEIGT